MLQYINQGIKKFALIIVVEQLFGPHNCKYMYHIPQFNNFFKWLKHHYFVRSTITNSCQEANALEIAPQSESGWVEGFFTADIKIADPL